MHLFDIYKTQIVNTMNRVYQNKMTTLSGGNISIIDEEGNVFITPSGVDKGNLSEKDIMTVSSSGEIDGLHKPSVEYPFHRHIYEVRNDIKAILHAHPVSLVAISAARQKPRTHLIDSMSSLLPTTTYAAYALPGSEQLGKNIADEFAKGYNIIFLENHGVVIGEKDLDTAYLIFEALVNFVDTEIKALSLKSNFINKGKLVLNNDFRISDNINTYGYESNQIVTLTNRAYKQKLFTSYFGSISVRVNEKDFLITPGNMDRMNISTDDIVLVRGGAVEDNKVPDELINLHQDIYLTHPEINSIFVATPSNVMAFAITDKEFNSHIIPEGYIMLREVVKLPPNQYTTVVETISKKTPIVLVENNYIIVAGNNLLQTYDRLEVLEFGANSLINAFLYGKVYSINDEEIAKINEHFNSW